MDGIRQVKEIVEGGGVCDQMNTDQTKDMGNNINDMTDY